MKQEFLTIKEVADLMRVHQNTVKNWLSAKEFPNAIRIGGTVRIPLSDIEALKQPRAEGA